MTSDEVAFIHTIGRRARQAGLHAIPISFANLGVEHAGARPHESER